MILITGYTRKGQDWYDRPIRRYRWMILFKTTIKHGSWAKNARNAIKKSWYQSVFVSVPSVFGHQSHGWSI